MKHAHSGITTPPALAIGLAMALSGCGTPTPAWESLGRKGMAPDDTGDPNVHHDYLVEVGGIRSTFVWIPRFIAFQLRSPEKAGHKGKPVGYWVKDLPDGTVAEAWDWEKFGGFYVGKYEASRAADGRMASVTGAAPWVDVTFDEARAAADALLPGRSHIVRGEEWTALAVWSQINGLTVRGNTDYGRDAEDQAITFQQPSSASAALTGTGSRADWAAGINFTSHTGGTDGVFDLVGNVREFDAALTNEGNEIVIDGKRSYRDGGKAGYFAELSVDATLRRYGIAGAVSSSGVAAFGQDYYHPPVYGTTRPGPGSRTTRGGWFEKGHHNAPDQAGIWLVCIAHLAESYKAPALGFRAALTF